MKNKLLLCLATAAYLLLPCLYAGLFLNTWFPYHLPGRQFLFWYLAHMACGCLLLYFIPLYRPTAPKLSFVFLGITLCIAIARMGQGLYHHKPILFLCLLTGIHVVLLLSGTRPSRPDAHLKN